MDWTKTPEDFAPDVYASRLRDVYVTGTTLDDWNQFLAYVRGSGVAFRFYRDGEDTVLPTSVEDIVAMHTEATTRLAIDPDEMCLHCNFFGGSGIELDFAPDAFDTPDKIERLSEFLAGLGRSLDKPVQVTHENSPHLLIWRYEPAEDGWIHWSESQAQR